MVGSNTIVNLLVTQAFLFHVERSPLTCLSLPRGERPNTLTTKVELVYHARPWTINEERAKNRWVRADRTREWRQAFFWLAKAQKIPCLTDCVIIATPYQEKGRMQDVAACVPAVKAAIDGIVDAGVLIDDAPTHLKAITFNQPQKGKPALKLEINGVCG